MHKNQVLAFINLHKACFKLNKLHIDAHERDLILSKILNPV